MVINILLTCLFGKRFINLAFLQQKTVMQQLHEYELCIGNLNGTRLSTLSIGENESGD